MRDEIGMRQVAIAPDQVRDPFEKALITLRKRLPQLVTGSCEPVAADGDILLYRRLDAADAIVIALNLGAEPVSISSSTIGFGREILISRLPDRQGSASMAHSICALTKAPS
jgi:hypothetical protein